MQREDDPFGRDEKVMLIYDAEERIEEG